MIGGLAGDPNNLEDDAYDLPDIDKMSTLKDLKGKLKEQGFDIGMNQMPEPVDEGQKEVIPEKSF